MQPVFPLLRDSLTFKRVMDMHNVAEYLALQRRKAWQNGPDVQHQPDHCIYG